jgi:outer membrane receptor protein involved in Fe transport
MRVKYVKWGLAAAVVLACAAGLASAADNGTLSGLVTDQNGQPVAGALVVVKGANRFATTNADGYYVISPVPVGTFEVKASRVGYGEQIRSNVKVIAGLRTNASFQLQSTSAGTTYIVSEEPLIKMNQTYTESIVGSEDIKNQVVDRFADMLARTPGISYENLSTGTLNLHIRGGRGSEVAYIVDGINITNPISGGAGMQVPVDAIEQMNIITAGWDAEYGEAQSGIINITTKEGREKYTGRAGAAYEPYTAKWNWDSHKALQATGLEEPASPLVTWHTATRQARWTKYRANFGGPAWPGNDLVGYFLSGDFNRDWTIYPKPNPDTEWNANGKITLKPSGKVRMSFGAGRYYLDQDIFDNQWEYVLHSNYYHRSGGTGRLSANFTHNVSDRFYYSVTGAAFNEDRILDINGKFWTDYDLSTLKTDPTGWFFTSGDYPLYEQRKQKYYDVRTDFALDIARVDDNKTLSMNQVKGGFGAKTQDIDFYQIQPYPMNVYTDVYHVYPLEGHAYIQDKLEYSGMILNLGLRLDVFDPNCSYAENPFNFQWGHSHQIDSETGEWRDFWTSIDPNAPYRTYNSMPRKKADRTYQVSPRVGISYPISDRDKLHFSYGHFFQVPPLIYVYRSTQTELTGAYPIQGNPDVAPQKTVQYEIGVEHLFTDNLKANVSAYFKDIRDLIDTERINYETGFNYTKVINADFGSVRGIEISVNQRVTKNFSGSMGYTFSVAKGLASSYYQGYNYAYRGWNLPDRENYLDWDQTHKVDITVDYRTDYKVHNFGTNTTLSYGSGMPYSEPRMGTGQPAINSERMPWTLNWNVKGDYSLTYWGITYGLYCEVLNIINRKNIMNFGMDEGDGAAEDWTPWYYFYGDADGPYDDIGCYGDPMRVRVGLDIGF